MKKEELLNHPDLYKMIRWAMSVLNVPIKMWADLEQEVILRIITHKFDEKSKASTIILRRTAWTIGDLQKITKKLFQLNQFNVMLVVEITIVLIVLIIKMN